MKKIFALVVVLTLILGSVSAYAGGDSSTSSSSGDKESVFQNLADWIKGK